MASTALQMNVKSASKMMERLRRVHAIAERTKEKAGEAIGTAVHSTEVFAGAFISGLAKGKLGHSPEFIGLPMDLWAAIIGHGAGFVGFGGRYSTHLHGFADGFLASYATTMGLGAGQSWAEKQAAEPKKP